MSEVIISSLVGGLCVAVPSIIATISSNRKNAVLMIYRIEQLEKKQDKHNSVIERTFKLEAEVNDIKEMIRKWGNYGFNLFRTFY